MSQYSFNIEKQCQSLAKARGYSAAVQITTRKTEKVQIYYVSAKSIPNLALDANFKLPLGKTVIS